LSRLQPELAHQLERVDEAPALGDRAAREPKDVGEPVLRKLAGSPDPSATIAELRPADGPPSVLQAIERRLGVVRTVH
jgi:hypothetical protein